MKSITSWMVVIEPACVLSKRTSAGKGFVSVHSCVEIFELS